MEPSQWGWGTRSARALDKMYIHSSCSLNILGHISAFFYLLTGVPTGIPISQDSMGSLFTIFSVSSMGKPAWTKSGVWFATSQAYSGRRWRSLLRSEQPCLLGCPSSPLALYPLPLPILELQKLSRQVPLICKGKWRPIPVLGQALLSWPPTALGRQAEGRTFRLISLVHS